MKLPSQLIRDFFTPIGPGGRLAVLLFVISIVAVSILGYFARGYIAEAVAERQKIRESLNEMRMEHQACMRKLTDAFKEIAALKKLQKS